MTAPIFTATATKYDGITNVMLGSEWAGTITKTGPSSFKARRKYGQVGVDVRVYSTRRSYDSALAWIAEQSPVADVHTAAARLVS